MRARLLFALLASLAVAACTRTPPVAAPASASRSAAAAPITITVVATTDLHGHAQSLPWLSGYLDILRTERRAQGGDVLLVDAGDMWQGTLESNLSEGGAVVRAYNALGYHAAAIGNHEFDFGPVGPATVPRAAGDNPTGNIEHQATQARFPFLAANLVRRDGTPWQPPNVQPSTIVQVAGVSVGLVGVTTMATSTATDPRNLVQLKVLPLLDVVKRETTALRARGATVVVLLAHAGGRCTAFTDADDPSTCSPNSEIVQLARGLPAGLVDVIAAGHSHYGMAHRINGIAIVQSFNEGRAFSRVDLEIDGTTRSVRAASIRPPRYLCDGATLRDITSWQTTACAPPEYDGRAVTFDTKVVQLLRRDIDAARARREQPLGVTVTHRYTHSPRDESPASHFVVDLLRAAMPGSDVAIYNATGTRAELPIGPVTYGGVYALLPFDSVIATATLDAGTLAAAIARGVTRGTLPVVSGIEVDVTCEGATPRVVIERDGRPLDPSTPLSVVTSEFLSSGGGGLFPDMEDRFTLQLDTPMREAVARVLPTQGEAIRAGRIGGFDSQHRRIRLPGGIYPVRCGSPGS
ncbi:MAG TPA: bifunctional UDP-sugar hydrolase/5'-nucleotidase [Luteitalea sp.]|nr:bifunctional UDP-sugar hydrolase/5'-nucleotidase [Luteitalea sp.]